MVDEGYAEATRLLKKHKKGLEAVAQALLEFETLTGDEIATILSGKKFTRDDDDKPKGKRASSVPTTKGSKGKGGKGSEAMDPQPQT